MLHETDHDLERAFELAGPAGARAFLEGLMAQDHLLRRRFISLYGELDLEDMKAGLATDLELLDGDYGYCDSWGDPCCSSEFEQVVRSHIAPVLKRRDVKTAFDLLEVVLDSLRADFRFDYDGHSYAVINLYIRYLETILSAAPAADVPALFASVAAKMDGLAALEGTRREDEYDSYLISEVSELLVGLYGESPAHARLVKEWAASRLAALEPGDYSTTSWVKAELNAMRAISDPTEDMLAFAQPYLGNLGIVQLTAQALAERGESGRACGLLEDALSAISGRTMSTDDAEAQLLRLYGACGRNEEERRLLEEMLVRRHGNGRIAAGKLLRRYRALWPEEAWPEAREALFSAMKCDYMLCDCLKEEGLDERLVAMLEKTHCSVESHEEFLLATGHADFVIKQWCEKTWSRAERSKNRHDYRYVADDLKHIAALPGGKATAKKLAGMIRDEYPRRTALDDEIRKVRL